MKYIDVVKLTCKITLEYMWIKLLVFCFLSVEDCLVVVMKFIVLCENMFSNCSVIISYLVIAENDLYRNKRVVGPGIIYNLSLFCNFTFLCHFCKFKIYVI